MCCIHYQPHFIVQHSSGVNPTISSSLGRLWFRSGRMSSSWLNNACKTVFVFHWLWFVGCRIIWQHLRRSVRDSKAIAMDFNDVRNGFCRNWVLYHRMYWVLTRMRRLCKNWMYKRWAQTRKLILKFANSQWLFLYLPVAWCTIRLLWVRIFKRI